MLRGLKASVPSIALVSAMALVGCANPTAPKAQPSEFDQRALIAALQSRGSSVTMGGPVEHTPLFPVTGRFLQVDGESVHVWEFASIAEAETAASGVIPDGGGTATVRVFWVAPPHFYRRDRLIALYVGSQSTLISSLAAIMGPQFAGR
jgi:hypothetical protein